MSSRIVWGVANIALLINRSPRQVWHLLENGRLRSVRKIGKRYVANEDDLLNEFHVAPEPTARAD